MMMMRVMTIVMMMMMIATVMSSKSMRCVQMSSGVNNVNVECDCRDLDSVYTFKVKFLLHRQMHASVLFVVLACKKVFKNIHRVLVVTIRFKFL